MKKILIIGALVVLALAVLAIPAGIGWLIASQAEPRLQERLPDSLVEWQRGWFRSVLNIDGPDVDADVTFRHASLSPPGWMSVDGRVILREPAAAIDVSGRVGLAMNGRVEASAPSLDIAGPVTWQYAAPRLEVRAEDDSIFADGQADTLFVADALGNRLALANVQMDVAIEQSGFDNIALRLDASASRAGQPDSKAAITLGPLDPRSSEQIVESLVQLTAAEPGSAAAGLAAVGLASAWQQAGAEGMVVELETLSLDDGLELTGRWMPGDRKFVLTGGGGREALLAWWSSIAGLAQQLPPPDARAAVLQRLDELAAEGVLRMSGDRIEIELDEVPGRSER